MKVRDLMTRDVTSCMPSTDLSSVARAMREWDCGALPVVAETRQVVGVITDRDICIATALQHRAPDAMHVAEVLSGKDSRLFTCTPETPAREALALMQRHKIRRLPVVNITGELVGMISLADLILAASTTATAEDEENAQFLCAAEIVQALQMIGVHRDHRAAA